MAGEVEADVVASTAVAETAVEHLRGMQPPTFPGLVSKESVPEVAEAHVKELEATVEATVEVTTEQPAMHALALQLVEETAEGLEAHEPRAGDYTAYRARLNEEVSVVDRDREAYVLQTSIAAFEGIASLKEVVGWLQTRLAVLRAQWERAQKTEDLEFVYQKLHIDPAAHENVPVTWSRAGVTRAERKRFLDAWEAGDPFPTDLPAEMYRVVVAMLYLTHDEDAPPSLALDITKVIHADMRDTYAALATVFFRKTAVERDGMRRMLVQAYLAALILYEELQSDEGGAPFSHTWHTALTSIWQQWFRAATETPAMYPALVFLGSAIGENILAETTPRAAWGGPTLDKLAVVGIAALKVRYGSLTDDNAVYCVSRGATVRFDTLWRTSPLLWPRHFGTVPAGDFDPSHAEHVYAVQGLILQVAALAAFGEDCEPAFERARTAVYAEAAGYKALFHYQDVVRVMESQFGTYPAVVLGASILLSFAPVFSAVSPVAAAEAMQRLQKGLLAQKEKEEAAASV